MVKKIFLIHAILELVAGIVLIFRPETLLMSDQISIGTLTVSKLYGVLAATFGTLSFMLYQKFEYNEFYRKMVLLCMVFHLFVAFQMHAAYQSGAAGNLGAFGIHLTMAGLFLLGYILDKNMIKKD